MRTSLTFVFAVWLIVISCGKGKPIISSQYGPLLDTWETRNSKVTIRVRKFQEKDPVFLHHFLYVFDSSMIETNTWRDIMTVRQNDDRPIPRDQVHFLEGDIVYLFMNSKFAVTTDRGGTWSVWDAADELRDWHQSYVYIQEANIDADGSGRLSLLPFPDSKASAPVFETTDYGRHWFPKQQ